MRGKHDLLHGLGDTVRIIPAHAGQTFSSFPHVCAEPWAEIMETQLANPKAYKLIEQYFPQSIR